MKILYFIIGIPLFALSIITLAFSKKLRIDYVHIKNVIEHKKTPKLDVELLLNVISIEDKRFFNHYGVDFYAIIRAVFKISVFSKLEGASTIEQQLVRVITNKRKISIKRKLVEIFFSIKLAHSFNKVDIITSYLNVYPFGENVKGIAELCTVEKYDFTNLTTYNKTAIAARLKYPIINHRNFTKYLKRVRTIEILNSNNYIP